MDWFGGSSVSGWLSEVDKPSDSSDYCSVSLSTFIDFDALTRRGGPRRGFGGSATTVFLVVFLFVRRGFDACWNSWPSGKSRFRSRATRSAN